MSASAKKISGAIACFALAAAVGCGGGSQSANSPAAVAVQTGTMAFSFKFGSSTSQANQRDPKYVSSNANSVVITLNGTSMTIGNSANGQCVNQSSGAKVCTVNINAPAGQVTYSGTVYDGQTGNGNVLGTFSGSTTITAGQTTPVTVTVNGTIATVVLTPVSGSSLAPCVIAVNASNNCGIVVNARDADGFTIVPPGNFANGPITLSITGDTANFAFTSSTQTTLTAPVQFTTGSNILISYNGKATTGATVTASVPGLAASAITNAVLAPGVPPITVPTASPVPTATSAATTPPPTAVPTSTPSSSPSPSPTSSSSTSFVPSCNQAPLTAGGIFFFLQVEGNVPAGGGVFTPTTQTSWFRAPLVAASASPSSSPSSNPTASATPQATPRPVNLYYGSFTVSGTWGSTAGCVVALATQGGTPLDRARLPQSTIRLPQAGGSASFTGFPNLAPGVTTSPMGVAFGTVSSVSLILNATGSSNGTFTLNDGSTGTLSLTANSTVQLVPNPTPSPSPTPGAVILNPSVLSFSFPGDTRSVSATQVGNSANTFTFTPITCPGPGSGTITQPSPGNFTVTASTTSSGQTCATTITGIGGASAQLRMTF